MLANCRSSGNLQRAPCINSEKLSRTEDKCEFKRAQWGLVSYLAVGMHLSPLAGTEEIFQICHDNRCLQKVTFWCSDVFINPIFSLPAHLCISLRLAIIIFVWFIDHQDHQLQTLWSREKTAPEHVAIYYTQEEPQYQMAYSEHTLRLYMFVNVKNETKYGEKKIMHLWDGVIKEEMTPTITVQQFVYSCVLLSKCSMPIHAVHARPDILLLAAPKQKLTVQKKKLSQLAHICHAAAIRAHNRATHTIHGDSVYVYVCYGYEWECFGLKSRTNLLAFSLKRSCDCAASLANERRSIRRIVLRISYSYIFPLLLFYKHTRVPVLDKICDIS